ncbi:unnamed protein product [Pedinophyceae sp. YPF-701]|nr:unnamed protein product [Pedinophyceae sp. YPF-701]
MPMFSQAQSMAGSVAARPAVVRTRRAAAAPRARVVRVCAGPPTVAETKDKFFKAYTKPVPAMYSTVINELLVSQHLWRYNKKYQYDELQALGLVSIFDQLLDEYNEEDKKALFEAYVNALDEDPDTYRKDAKFMEEWASGSPEVKPDAAGDEGQQKLAAIAERVAAGDFYYSKLFAIGLFRVLECAGASSPEALKGAVAALGVREDAVNRDLMMYKGVLSKLTAAKEMMAEFLERERRKTEERKAEKAAKAAKEAEPAKEESAASAEGGCCLGGGGRIGWRWGGGARRCEDGEVGPRARRRREDSVTSGETPRGGVGLKSIVEDLPRAQEARDVRHHALERRRVHLRRRQPRDEVVPVGRRPQHKHRSRDACVPERLARLGGHPAVVRARILRLVPLWRRQCVVQRPVQVQIGADHVAQPKGIHPRPRLLRRCEPRGMHPRQPLRAPPPALVRARRVVHDVPVGRQPRQIDQRGAQPVRREPRRSAAALDAAARRLERDQHLLGVQVGVCQRRGVEASRRRDDVEDGGRHQGEQPEGVGGFGRAARVPVQDDFMHRVVDELPYVVQGLAGAGWGLRGAEQRHGDAHDALRAVQQDVRERDKPVVAAVRRVAVREDHREGFVGEHALRQLTRACEEGWILYCQLDGVLVLVKLTAGALEKGRRCMSVRHAISKGGVSETSRSAQVDLTLAVARGNCRSEKQYCVAAQSCACLVRKRGPPNRPVYSVAESLVEGEVVNGCEAGVCEVPQLVRHRKLNAVSQDALSGRQPGALVSLQVRGRALP